VGVRVPVVVRLEGTNAEAARAKLAGGSLAIIPASDLTDAARKVVAAARAAATKATATKTPAPKAPAPKAAS
jgi:succinyl-CoA synthetase beta subunit